MDLQQISSLMGMIHHQQEMLETERDEQQKELDKHEESFESVKHLLPVKEQQKALDCMNKMQKHIQNLERAIFGLRETWSSLDMSKINLDEIEEYNNSHGKG